MAVPEPILSGQPVWLDGGDRPAVVLAQMSHPRVVVLGGVLSDAECDALVEMARPRMTRSRTVNAETGGQDVHEARTSDGACFGRGETPLVAQIEARIERLVNWPVTHGEGLQVLRYGVGAEYKPHHDYFDPALSGSAAHLVGGGQRVGTLLLYLNDPVQGGGTVLPDVGLTVTAKKGGAVFFSYDRPHADTRTLHGGLPVLAGEKWVATKWLRERAA